MEREQQKNKLLQLWKYSNYATLVIALGIGGAVGLGLAAIDVGQLYFIKRIEERRKR